MAFGRLDRSKGSEPMADINMTPLIDVMLVLVVIFILTAPLLASSIRLDLPKTDAAKGSSGTPFVTLVLNAAGQLYLNDKPVTPEALSAQLAQTAADAPETEVQLRADTTVPYGRVVEVMGLAQKAGLNRIGFVADAPSTPSAPAAKPSVKP